MKFVVSRTSDMLREGQPCKEAVKLPYLRIDERSVDDPKKIAFYGHKDEWWFSEGKNHRVEHGHIKRDYDAEAWFLEINSLDELMKFQEKYGQIVIQRYMFNHDILELEIYDSYRE
jgi:hypothetical protein